MALENNPLKQYFRKPAIYVKLPSNGKGYKPETIDMPINEELPVYPMTALDEITVKTPDALYNGTAIIDLIKSCVPNIKNPWDINSVDLDALLIAIRTATEGNKTEMETKCPSCEEVSKYEINLIAGLQDLDCKIYEDELNLDEISLKFKPLSFKNLNEISTKQFELQKLFLQIDENPNIDIRNEKSKEILKEIARLSMYSLCKTIDYIKTPIETVDNQDYIINFLQNCDKKTYDTIRDYSVKLKKSSEMKPLKIQCIHCTHQYEQTYTLNMSDFFE